MRRTLLALSSMSLLGLLLVGCGDVETSSDDSPGGSDPTGDTVCATTDAKDDLLAQICDKGVLTVSTDPAYPPQSKYVPKEDKYEGFDIDVATEIANRLGSKSRGRLRSGKSSRPEVERSVGHERRLDAPDERRQKVLDFTEPYYYTPAVVR